MPACLRRTVPHKVFVSSRQCKDSCCNVQDGVSETGVSVAFTVRAMDAGPVLAQERVAVDDVIQAPELMEDLFRRGTELLIRHLPMIWDSRAQQQAVPQVCLPLSGPEDIVEHFPLRQAISLLEVTVQLYQERLAQSNAEHKCSNIGPSFDCQIPRP